MADTITLIPQDDAAAPILEQFEQRTGLEADRGDDGTRVYAIEGEDHRIKIVQTLTEIDADWEDHLAFGQPA